MSTDPVGVANKTPEGWSAEDGAWLWERVPEHLHTIAIRHGRMLFTLTMTAGAANHASGILAQRLRKDRQGAQALMVLSQGMNSLLMGWLQSAGKSLEDYGSCHKDIETLAALMDASRQVVSSSIRKRWEL